MKIVNSWYYQNNQNLWFFDFEITIADDSLMKCFLKNQSCHLYIKMLKLPHNNSKNPKNIWVILIIKNISF
jgi:hypothetical protein